MFSFVQLLPELSACSALVDLNLRYNKIEVVPNEIGQVCVTRSLDAYASLSRCALRVHQLTNLGELNLSGNPIKKPAAEALLLPLRLLLAHLRGEHRSLSLILSSGDPGIQNETASD